MLIILRASKALAKTLTFDSIDNYVARSSNERIKKILEDNEDIIERNKKLITLNRHLDIEDVDIGVLSDKIHRYSVYEILSSIDAR